MGAEVREGLRREGVVSSPLARGDRFTSCVMVCSEGGADTGRWGCGCDERGGGDATKMRWVVSRGAKPTLVAAACP